MSKKTWLISMAALAAVGVFACSDEEDPDDGTGSNPDGGFTANPDGSVPGADGGQCTTVFGVTGMLCTTPDGKSGYKTCTNGVPSTGPCMAIALPGGDGGTDGGFTIPGFDASGLFPDGAISIPDGALNNLPACGTGFSCGGMGFLTGIIEGFASAAAPGVQGVSYCAATGDQVGLPPMCNAPADCTTAGLTGANCMDTMGFGKFCVQPCKK